MMAIRATHDLHRRRFSRNLGVALVLAAFILVMFALTVVKVTSIGATEAFDHAVRPEMVPAE